LPACARVFPEDETFDSRQIPACHPDVYASTSVSRNLRSFRVLDAIGS
jgi:hypothetical protein